MEPRKRGSMAKEGSAESFSFVLWCPRKEQIKSTHTMWYSPLEKTIQTTKAKRSYLINNIGNQPTASHK